MREHVLKPLCHQNRPLRHAERGQAAIMTSLGVTVLFGVLGLVIDVGYGYYVKQQAQAAADSAALAAAVSAQSNGYTCGDVVLCQTAYACPPNPTNTTNFGAGCLYAKTNGFKGDAVNLSSGTGAVGGANVSYWVTATVTGSMPSLFSAILGTRNAPVLAAATGAVIATGGGRGCIYVLDPTQGQSMTVSGGSSFIRSDCGIYVNSSASNALNVSGGATVTAGVVDVVGGTQINGGSTVTPTPTTGMSAAADPLGSLPAPTFTGCDHNSFTVSGATVTLSPGVYCDGITITGTSNVTFQPGNYFLNGGGFTSSSSTTTLNGSGVFFYNTSAGYSFKPVTLSGGTNVTLTAPTSGTYRGILFFQDRSINSSSQNTISGGSTDNLSGSIYMPTGQLVFSGGSTSGPLTLAIVVKDFTVSGASYLRKDTTGALTGMGSLYTALVQ
jgi:hypothetical protein